MYISKWKRIRLSAWTTRSIFTGATNKMHYGIAPIEPKSAGPIWFQKSFSRFQKPIVSKMWWRVAKTFSAFCGHGRFQNGDAVLCVLAWPCNFFNFFGIYYLIIRYGSKRPTFSKRWGETKIANCGFSESELSSVQLCHCNAIWPSF